MKSAAARLAPFVLTVGLLVVLARQVDLPAVGRLLVGMSPGWLAVGVALYLGVNLLRALRFRLLVPGAPGGMLALLPLSLAVTMLNNTLPLRSGDVSFLVLARSRYRVAVPEATAALGLARLLDFLAVSIWFLPPAILALPRLPEVVGWPVPQLPTTALLGSVILVVLGGTLLLLGLAGLGRRAVGALTRVLARLGLTRSHAAARLLAFAAATVDALVVLRRRDVAGPAFLLSLLAWLLTMGWLFAYVRALGWQPDPGLFVVGVTFGSLANALPTPTLGGHGVAETGWALGFVTVGWAAEDAIASGLAVGALNLLAVLLLGLPALAWLGWFRRREGG